MRKLFNLFSSLLLLLLFIASATFSYFNSTPVVVSLVVWKFPPLPISVWVIGAFVTGGTIGLALGLSFSNFRRVKYRFLIKKLNKKLEVANSEIAKLRTMTLKDLP